MANKCTCPTIRYFGPIRVKRRSPSACTRRLQTCRSSAPTATWTRACSADPDYSLGSPADLLIVPDITSSGCSIPRVCRWSRWDSAEGRQQGREGPPKGLADLRRSFPSLPATPPDVAGHELPLRLRRGGKALRRIRPADLRSDRREAGHAGVPARAMFERFNIEFMSRPMRPRTRCRTTRPSESPAGRAGSCRASGRRRRQPGCANWAKNIQVLSAVSKVESRTTRPIIAPRESAAFFKRMGAPRRIMRR